MAKKEMSFFDLSKCYIFLNPFTKSISLKKTYLLGLSLLVLTLIMNFIKTQIGYEYYGIETFFVNLLSIPLFLLGVFVVFSMFFHAFEDKRKPFLESFGIFSTLTMHFYVIAFLLLLGYIATYNEIFMFFIGLELLYFLTVLVVAYSRYYKTSKSKVASSLVLCLVPLLMLAMTIAQTSRIIS